MMAVLSELRKIYKAIPVIPPNTSRAETIARKRQEIADMLQEVNKDTGRPRIDRAQVQKIYQAVMKKKEKRILSRGEGSAGEGGLYDDQIDKIMSHFKDYRGSIMRDQIKELLPSIRPQSRVAFIINTDTSDKPGQHWQAIYIDARDGPESSNSLEFYDSFGRSIPPDVLQDCKLILKMLKPHTILKLKENRVIVQADNSTNCGYFCMRFLMDRFRGKSFASATGYDDKVKIDQVHKNEKEIEDLKQKAFFLCIT